MSNDSVSRELVRLTAKSMELNAELLDLMKDHGAKLAHQPTAWHQANNATQHSTHLKNNLLDAGAQYDAYLISKEQM